MNESDWYDDALQAGTEETPCPICTGHPTASPCSERCFELMYCAKGRIEARGLFKAARKSMSFARRYELENGVKHSASGYCDQRIVDVLRQVARYRSYIRATRRQMVQLLNGPDEAECYAPTEPAPAMSDEAAQ